jgi:predicted MFS family arabinose efflux permease
MRQSPLRTIMGCMATRSTSIPSSSKTRHDRLFTPAFVRLAVADLAYFTAAGVAIYTLPLYVTGPVGSDTGGAGLAFGAFAISALVLRPFAGRLSDSRGRRPLLVGGAALCAVAMLLTALVDSLALVVGLRLVLGVAEAAFFVASFAALADLAPPSRMGEALSYNSLGLYLGLALGPPLGEVLVETISYAAAWYGAAVLSLIALVVAMGIGETRTPRSSADPPARLIHWKAVPPAIGFFTSLAAIGGFLAFASLQASAVGLPSTSIPLFVYGVVVVVGRIAFAKIPDRLPSLPLGAAALALIAGGLTVTAAWTAPVGMVAGAVLLALGVTFSTPAFFAAVFATAAPSERGAASGTVSAFLDLGLGGGPILLGVVAEAFGIPSAFGVAAAVALAGCIWTIGLAQLWSRRALAR